MLLLLLGGVVVASIFVLMVINRGVEAFKLSMGDGRIIQATVTKPALAGDRARYEFQVNGVNYRGLAGDEARGEKVKVAYLVSDPALNRPAKDLLFDMLMGVGAPLGLIVALIIFFWQRPDTVASVLLKRRIEEQMRRVSAGKGREFNGNKK